VSKGEKRSVKAEIPRELYHAIVRVQAAESLDWPEACQKAALLLDANSEAFKQAVEREAERLAKKRFMRQVNAARKSIRANAVKWGQQNVRMWEDNFHVPCSICGKPMHFSSRDRDWEKEKALLYEAFKSWRHTTCKG